MTAHCPDLGLGHLRLGRELEPAWAVGQEYGAPEGWRDLRTAIAAWERVPLDHIAITTGASLGLVSSLAALNPPYSLLCPRPHYPAYPRVATLLGLDVLYYPLEREHGWLPDPADLRRLLRKDTRAVLWNFPHNPTGSVAGATLLDELATIATDAGLVVISDEVYDGLVYADPGRIAPHGIEGRQLIRLRSFSKQFGIPGERVGYVIADPHWLPAISKAHWALSMSPPATSQALALTLLRNHPNERLRRVRAALARKRDLAFAILDATDCVRADIPDASVFCWVEAPEWPSSSLALASACRRECGVTVVPGAVFGVEFPAYLRLSFAVPDDELREGFSRVVAFLQHAKGDHRSGDDGASAA